MSNWVVLAIGSVIGVALTLVVDSMRMDYAYLAAYTVLQFIVMASAFNILAGYGGYINFGSAGFFGIGGGWNAEEMASHRRRHSKDSLWRSRPTTTERSIRWLFDNCPS